jgi:hypothetical protein
MSIGFLFPKPVNMTQPGDVTAYLNSTTGDLYGSVLLIGIFILGVVVQKRVDTDSLLAAGFGTAILGSLFRILGFVSDTSVVAFIVMASIGFVVSVLGRRST